MKKRSKLEKLEIKQRELGDKCVLGHLNKCRLYEYSCNKDLCFEGRYEQCAVYHHHIGRFKENG